jgi:hypothetical protein
VNRFVLIFASLSLAAAPGFAVSPAWVRVDVPVSQGIHLDEYGVKRKWIEVISSDAGSVEFFVSNGARRVISRGFGPKPTAKSIPKEHGISVDGSAAQAYLLFEDKGSGCQVYFDDTSDTKQNEYALLVVPAHQSGAAAKKGGGTPPPRSRPATVPGTLAEKPPRAETTSTAPHFSLMGETLLYHSNALTDHVSQDAAKAGLDRDLFVQERAWIEKERDAGRASHAEFERLKQRRIEHLPEETRAAVERLRASLLGNEQ